MKKQSCRNLTKQQKSEMLAKSTIRLIWMCLLYNFTTYLIGLQIKLCKVFFTN